MKHAYAMRVTRAVVVASVALSLTACATITRGAKQKWIVETDPAGALVKTSNGYTCEPTPCSIKMPRKAKFDVTVTKTGHKPATAHVSNEINGAGMTGMAGNLIIGGMIGAGVDLATGATQDLYPNPLVLMLEPETSEPAVAAGQQLGIDLQAK